MVKKTKRQKDKETKSLTLSQSEMTRCIQNAKKQTTPPTDFRLLILQLPTPYLYFPLLFFIFLCFTLLVTELTLHHFTILNHLYSLKDTKRPIAKARS